MAKRMTAIKAIQEFCRYCTGTEKGGDLSLIRECAAGPEMKVKDPYSYCVLWPYRLGRNPAIKKTPEQKARLVENLKKARVARFGDEDGE